MCDFKPGDRVERFRECFPGHPDNAVCPPVGHVGVVTWAGQSLHGSGIEIDNWPLPDRSRCFHALEWRKVQPRDLGAWLKTATKNTDKIDKSAREKVKV